MKNKKWRKKGIASILLAAALLVSNAAAVTATQETSTSQEEATSGEETTTSESETASGEETTTSESETASVVEISDVSGFLEMADRCTYDRYSTGKTFSLTKDIDLSKADFEGIPYFDGTFEGNGHLISGVNITVKGSEYGFFRTIGENAVVSDLHVSGTVAPTGTKECIGGIAGVNYGTVQNCSFSGEVSGENMAGGLVGKNEESGIVADSSFEGTVLATDNTGGIVGKNLGTITSCKNSGSINTEELDTTLDMGGVDLGTLNLTQNLVNRYDTGGIAGSSTGIIRDCKNEGTIGFNHTGYNVGGIAGSQSGVIAACENTGEVYGRKDVGGIVGQAEPYIESEYLEDKIDQTKDDITRLTDTLSGISSTLSSTSDEVKRNTETLNQQYTQSMDSISASLDELTQTAQAESPDAQQYVDNINSAMEQIEAIQSEEGALTEEQIDEIQNQLGVINDNLGNVQGVYTGTADSAEDLVNNISDELKNNGQEQSIADIVSSVDNGIQKITSSLDSAISQMKNMADSIADDIDAVTDGESQIEDISSIATAEQTNGVLTDCTNRGKITGDLNVGGIAGTMNIEYDVDPEYDLDFTGTSNITIRSTVNNVVIHSKNYGSIHTKKNCAGGIVGLQELGFVYDCEGYGRVQSDSGNYLGGIAGSSLATIQHCYSFCNLEGSDYLGGIAGSGETIKESVSICQIESEGEALGSIAGTAGDEGTIESNYYMSEENGKEAGAGRYYPGIDGVCYAGRAEAKNYEEIMQLEGIPEGFSRVFLTFEVEDTIISETTLAYGGSLTEEDFPEVEEKEGYYVEWDGGTSLDGICENRILTAEYVPWTQSVASAEKTEDKKSYLLLTGEFYDGTEVVLEEIQPEATFEEAAELAYAYRFTLSSEREKEQEELEGHFVIPTDAAEAQVWLNEDGTWKLAETVEDGSYLVTGIQEGTEFAVVTMPEKGSILPYAVGAAAVIVIIILLIWRKKKKKVVE